MGLERLKVGVIIKLVRSGHDKKVQGGTTTANQGVDKRGGGAHAAMGALIENLFEARFESLAAP